MVLLEVYRRWECSQWEWGSNPAWTEVVTILWADSISSQFNAECEHYKHKVAKAFIDFSPYYLHSIFYE